MADDFLATVVGGLIAGAAGVAAAYAQQWLTKRDWVWEHVLGPIYNFMRDITDHPLKEHFDTNPWDGFGWYDRRKVRHSLRTQIEEFSSVLEGYRKSKTDFENHFSGPHQVAHLSEMVRLLGTYVDGENLRWAMFGKEGEGSWPVKEFFGVVYLEVVRHPKDEDAAWKAVGQLGPGKWDVVMETLRARNPATLTMIHRHFVSDTAFARSEELLRNADQWRTAVVDRALALRQILEKTFRRP